MPVPEAYNNLTNTLINQPKRLYINNYLLMIDGRFMFDVTTFRYL